MRPRPAGSAFRWTDTGMPNVPKIPESSLPDKFQFRPDAPDPTALPADYHPDVARGATFGRRALATALDAAALPVTAASRAADYFTGRNSPMSNLSGDEAAESLEWLWNKKEPADIRMERRYAAVHDPYATKAGEFLGEYAGGAPLSALTGRVPTLGPVLRVIDRNRKQTPRVPAAELRAKDITAMNEDHAGQVADKLQSVFRGSVGPDDLPELTGVPAGTHVNPRYEQSYMKNESPGLHVKVPTLGDAADGSAAGEMARYYYRDPATDRLVARHDLLVLKDSEKGKGLGSEVFNRQIDAYKRAGVDEVHTEAAWDGRYVWPKKGFELRDPADFPPIRKKFDAYLKRHGVDPKTVPAQSVSEIANSDHGKGFLLSKGAPQMSLKLDLTGAESVDLPGPSGAAPRNQLGISPVREENP